ncbi:flagellar biosynthetic protein FlhB [Desulfovibrio sp. X2]|uniref:flagellar biosynthesis protein FlhB n=1 Tax=Desulfovibrio sp. X2 TaxID=941449 RepID=UPI000358A55C|nr:flagellar biosynthesis protein FlhB [Desulfovibrio sp. X2]EPR42442.1 flagellar biosynthetic protein FlhB [Desulfovibrio sp. X2]
MAQKDPSRTEDATAKRVKKARDDGSVAKSQEFSKSILMLAATVGCYFLLQHMGKEIMNLYRWFFQEGLLKQLTEQSVYSIFVMVSVRLAVILLPIFFLLAFVAYLTMRLQVGKLWSPKVLEFKFKFLDIASGLNKMMLSPQTFVNLGRSLLQAVAVALAPYFVLKHEAPNLLPLFYASPSAIAAYILQLLYKMFTYAMLPMLIIGVIDLIYQRWNYKEQLKMTKQEVKDERKQMEGDPVVKQKQRRKMLESMAQRMLEKVPKADVVITNPTHFAVALQYDAMTAPAPVVVAKGVDHLAEKIKEVAREHGVPIRENRPLARALYKQVELGEMIPEEMYQAVAAILAQIRRVKRGG